MSIQWQTFDSETSKSHVLSELYICVDAKSPFNNLITHRPISPSPLTTECRRTMQSWLTSCRESHTYCTPFRNEPFPTRVIDIQDPFPRLGVPITIPTHMILHKPTRGEKGQWTALSHVWGATLPLKLTLANLEVPLKLTLANLEVWSSTGIPYDEFPATFKDAVRVTWALGFRYLWIDALCIVQDDPEDWKREAEKMVHVYSHASVTIAVDASPNSNTGIIESSRLLREAENARPTSRLTMRNRNTVGRSSSSTLYFRKPPPDVNSPGAAASRVMKRGPLSTRGWTLQEEILSPRIMYFLEGEVKWRCARTTRAEGNPDHHIGPNSIESRGFAELWTQALHHLSSVETSVSLRKAGILQFWYTNVVNTYTSRNLTFSTDILIAISGIARKISHVLPGFTIIAGLWKQDFHRGLDWLTPFPNARPRQRTDIAPSWSWASYDMSGGGDDGGRVEDAERKGPYEVSLTRKFVRFTPLGIVSELNEPGHIDKTSENRWSFKITSQHQTLCSCHVPLPFLDQRSYPPTAPSPSPSPPSSSSPTQTPQEIDSSHRRRNISSPRNGFLPTLGIDKIMKLSSSKCNVITTNGSFSIKHKKCTYVQFGRWDGPLSETGIYPTIQALILEKVVRDSEGEGAAGDEEVEVEKREKKEDAVVWRRIGRACIPLLQAHLSIKTPEWPVGSFVVI